MANQNMRYEWEDDWMGCPDVDEVGALVVNTDTVEAAVAWYEDNLPPLGSLARCDVLKDILGDAQAAYDESVRALQNEPKKVVSH